MEGQRYKAADGLAEREGSDVESYGTYAEGVRVHLGST